ncbi:hypothetical protein EZV73_14845 [Acidaminobacter sp. JC074]|uniref:glycoside hydrolase domain-containing protein n=1 Tax=Acidaminobacter sp. JC074 TaxID=2530199 RepID=UPI001F104915|nr:glycoside hydrolase domain-containing protein [Acidaminobacter sp. JC074]MCH4888871.1 hypothetical protein [Acidaminobacter sp. JC074]
MKIYCKKSLVDINELCKEIEFKALYNSYNSFPITLETENVLENVSFNFEIFSNGKREIDHKRWTCFNIGGIDCNGRRFTKRVDVVKHKELWLGLDLKDIEEGVYKGCIHLTADNFKMVISVRLVIEKDVRGHLPRMSWLNSKIGQEDIVLKDYLPIEMKDRCLKVNNKTLLLADKGLIESVTYHQEELLNGPLSINISSMTKKLVFQESPWAFLSQDKSKVTYRKFYTNDSVTLVVDMLVSVEGFIQVDLRIRVSDKMRLNLDLNCPLNEKHATYMMGLDFDGGLYRPYDFTFNDNHQDAIWIGSHKMGISMKFKDDNYIMPFSNVYYKNRPLNKSVWDKISLSDHHELQASTRDFIMEAFEKKTISIEMNLTPFKRLDMKKHFKRRYYQPKENSHMMACIDDILDKKCQVLNIHHGQDVYPYINYPFNHKEALSKLIQSCHQKEVKVKLYYTMRELSHHIDELQAFHSLDYELFPKNDYNSPSFWDLRNERLKENDGLDIGYHTGYINKTLDKDLIPAWEHQFEDGTLCAAILTETHSRLNNFYMAGLKWMIDNLDIDGIYIDDTFLDRSSMIRLRRILQVKDDFDIDLHSWNHRHDFAGQVSSLMLYMQVMPFVDRLWIGESYDYNKGPDYWLTEISGIPFGLTSDMLEGDGHLYRGMLYGMTNRTRWGDRDPLSMYDLWDSFGIKDSRMVGYWEDHTIRLKSNHVKLTCYYKDDCVLLAFASWADEEVIINLSDLDLKLNRPVIPHIEGIQDYQVLDKMEIKIPSNGGKILICQYGVG